MRFGPARLACGAEWAVFARERTTLMPHDDIPRPDGDFSA